MQFPAVAVGVDEHREKVLAEETDAVAAAAGDRGRTVRISVVAGSGDPGGLRALLLSLAAAKYDGVADGAVSLDVWLFASSMASAIPVVFLPLAIAVFGPQRFDHSSVGAANDFRWPHGPKHIIAQRSEPDWAVVWSPSAAGANETVIFVDATRARAVAPTFFNWLSAARMTRPDIGAYALDALAFSETHIGSFVAMEAFLPTTAVWSPSRDVWVTFLKWRRMRARQWWPSPVLPKELNVNGYDAWEALRIDPLRAWFTQFLYEYHALVVHPVLRDGQVLVVRKPGCTGSVPGAGVAPGPQLSVNAEMRVNALSDSEFKIPKADPMNLIVLKWDGERRSTTSVFGDSASAMAISEAAASSHTGRPRRVNQRQLQAQRKAVRRLGVQDLVAPVPISGGGGQASPASLFAAASARDVASVENDHAVLVKLLLDHARRYGGGTVAATLVLSEKDVLAAHSWLCNVETLGIAPPSLVMLVPSKVEAVRLRNFANTLVTWRQQRRHLAPIVMPLHTGNSGLEFLLVLRDLLDHGVNVLRFRVDQVWLSNPLLYVENIVSSTAHEQKGAVASAAAVAAAVQPRPVHAKPSKSMYNIHALFASSRYSADDDDDPTAPVDMVLARNSEGRVVSGFMYMRATFNARFFLSEIVSLLANDALKSGALTSLQEGRLVNALTSGSDRWHSKRFPTGKWLAVNRDLFVDGTWYQGFTKEAAALKKGVESKLDLTKTPYSSELSYHPVVANLDMSADEDSPAWEVRARHAGHWFTNEANFCDADSVHDAMS